MAFVGVLRQAAGWLLNPSYLKSHSVVSLNEFSGLTVHGKFWKVLPLDFGIFMIWQW
nr:MAG TPA: hypothetical protein [Caudoviricetes sp.]